MVKSDEENSQATNLVDRCDEKVLINFSLNLFTLFSDSIFRIPIATSTTIVIAKLEDRNIQQLIEILQSLDLFIYTI